MLSCQNAEIKLHFVNCLNSEVRDFQFELYPRTITAESAEEHRTGLVSSPSGLLVPNTQICEIEFLTSGATIPHT